MAEAPETANDARLRREREDRATQLAVKQALKDQAVELRLDQHSTDIKDIRSEFRSFQTSTTSQLTGLTKQLTRVEDTLPQLISTAISAAAEKASEKSISARGFYLSVLGIIVALITLAVSSGHL